jgi:RimJ/RimL family protein N-acetyltransferase
MMGWARQRHGIHTFVVSVWPLNEPSPSMAAGLGFKQTGSRIDELDGEKWVFELTLDGAAEPSALEA